MSIALSFMLASAAIQIGTVFPDPPAHAPEALFLNTIGKDVAAKIASGCMDLRWPVQSHSDTQVTCELPPDELMVTIQQLGGPRNSKLRGVANFSLVDIDGNVRVQADRYTELTNVFGQTSQSRNRSVDIVVQDFLIAVGGGYVTGTTFKGTDLGIRGFINRENNADGLKITSIAPNGPSEAAGLQIGDRILRINGKRVPIENDEFRWFVGKIKPGQNIIVQIDRSGTVSDFPMVARTLAPIP